MFPRAGKRFFSSGQLWKPKNPHSLEYLKYLYGVLCKNQSVTEQNRSLLVEALRSMSEILIWGDQNDDTVFDFFLEKSLLSFFLNYMKQKSGQFICVQLLQTLSILFENISKESSVYYLLSNNHVNSIICQKLDFNDEEVMAYYISFLKTLSLKLNKHTIHFFYNEHTNDFALYTEAIKFFNHPESMVRIAVRTITLNVYRVDDKAMMRYIREKSAGPYFANLVWVMGSHALEMDACIRSDHTARARLSDLVSEHLDQLHYIGDVLRLGIDALNSTLTDYLVDGLLLPLIVRSLFGGDASSGGSPGLGVKRSLAAFLLAHLFLAVHHPALCRRLLDAALAGPAACRGREFVRPAESLAEALDKRAGRPRPGIRVGLDGSVQRQGSLPDEEAANPSRPLADAGSSSEEGSGGETFEDALDDVPPQQPLVQASQSGGLLEVVLSALEAAAESVDSPDADSFALHSLGLLHAIGRSPGLPGQSIERIVSGNADRLAEALLRLLASACRETSRLRLATAELAAELLDRLASSDNADIADRARRHGLLDSVRQASTVGVQLRFHSGDDLFLDLFEDELARLKPVNLELLLMDSSLLLAPAATPMSGVDDFARRLPCGEVERSRRSVRLFLRVRQLCQRLKAGPAAGADSELPPLGGPAEPVRVADSLDLNNSDLIGCRVEREAGRPAERRFLVVDPARHQAMLVEPDSRRLGWGVAKFVGYLQHVEAASDREDSRCLHVTFHNPGTAPYGGPRPPLLAARFIFDDHIRCMAARQRLVKGRQRVRREKSVRLAALLGLTPAIPAPTSAPGNASAPAPTSAAAASGRTTRREKRLSASRTAAPTSAAPAAPASPPASLVSRHKRPSGSAAASAAAAFAETCLLSPAEADRVDLFAEQAAAAAAAAASATIPNCTGSSTHVSASTNGATLVGDVPPLSSNAEAATSAAASPGASNAEAAASPGASNAEAAASPGASNAEAAASPGASNAEAAASPGASNAEAAASPGASNAEAAASPGASNAEAAASPGASNAEAAASPGASNAEAAASPGASNAEAAASPGASNAEAAASPGASNAEAAASPGASNAEAAASPGASNDESAASTVASNADGPINDS